MWNVLKLSDENMAGTQVLILNCSSSTFEFKVISQL